MCGVCVWCVCSKIKLDPSQNRLSALLLGDVSFHDIDNDNDVINNEHGQMPCESFDRNGRGHNGQSTCVLFFVYNSAFIRRHEFIA